MNEVQKTINEIIKTHGEIIDALKAERDELTKRLESAKMALDAMRDLRDRYRIDFVQARLCAVAMRDLYVAKIGESIQAFPLPWEVQNERD